MNSGKNSSQKSNLIDINFYFGQGLAHSSRAARVLRFCSFFKLVFVSFTYTASFLLQLLKIVTAPVLQKV